MSCERVLRIDARGLNLHVHAGQLQSALLEACDLRGRETRADGQWQHERVVVVNLEVSFDQRERLSDDLGNLRDGVAGHGVTRLTTDGRHLAGLERSQLHQRGLVTEQG